MLVWSPMAVRSPARLLFVACITLPIGGCGAVDDLLGGIGGWWSDPEQPADPVEVVPAAASTGGEPARTSDTGDLRAEHSTTAGMSRGRATKTGGSTDGASTLLPMSYDRPPTGTGGTDGQDAADPTGSTSVWGATKADMAATGAADTAGSSTGHGSGTGGAEGDTRGAGGTEGDTGGTEGDTGPAAGTSAGGTPAIPGPPAGGVSCLEGAWAVKDITAYYRHHIRRRAHGRRVSSRGLSGDYALAFDGKEMTAEATRLRLSFVARLADNDIRYTITVRGKLVAPFRVEGGDTLVVSAPSRDTMRARESVEFPGGKTKTRGAPIPGPGRYAMTCSASALELRSRGRDGALGPTIRFIRPAP